MSWAELAEENRQRMDPLLRKSVTCPMCEGDVPSGALLLRDDTVAVAFECPSCGSLFEVKRHSHPRAHLGRLGSD